MTIGPLEVIDANDLNTLVTPALALLQADNGRPAGGVPFTLTFAGLVASAADYRRKVRFVVPVDMVVDSIAVQCSPAHSDTATCTVDITGDGALPSFAMRVIGQLSSTVTTKLPRLLFDNAPVANPGVDPKLTSRVGRLLTQGTTVLVTISTTNTRTKMVAQVTIACRSKLAREIA